MIGQLAALILAAPVTLSKAPFSAEQLRQATHEGRTYVVRTSGTPPTHTRFKFTALSAEGGTLEVTHTGPDAAPKPTKNPFTWKALERHGQFPKGHLRIIRGVELKSVLGTVKCDIYATVSERHWFCPDFPGMPLRSELPSKGAAPIVREVVEHQNGRPPASKTR